MLTEDTNVTVTYDLYKLYTIKSH